MEGKNIQLQQTLGQLGPPKGGPLEKFWQEVSLLGLHLVGIRASPLLLRVIPNFSQERNLQIQRIIDITFMSPLRDLEPGFEGSIRPNRN